MDAEIIVGAGYHCRFERTLPFTIFAPLRFNNRERAVLYVLCANGEVPLLSGMDEADFVEGLGARSVLDAGCGTGRVAVELARRGADVVGVDVSSDMLARARASAPHLPWVLGDLASVDLGRAFDAVLLAGNVMIFLDRGTEGAVLRNMAHHLAPRGHLVTGFYLSMGYLDLDEYDRLADEAGLVLTERYSGWRREPWRRDSKYAVSVHTLRTGGE